MARYRIGKGQTACTVCGREFEDGEEVYSCVYSGEESLERGDICQECWDAGKAPEHISSWKRRIEKKEPPRRFDRKAALDLFRVLVDSEETRDADTAFILAVLLMRKKVFELERSGTENGKKIMILRLKGSSDEFKVQNRELDDERLNEVKDNLESIFEGG